MHTYCEPKLSLCLINLLACTECWRLLHGLLYTFTIYCIMWSYFSEMQCADFILNTNLMSPQDELVEGKQLGKGGDQVTYVFTLV